MRPSLDSTDMPETTNVIALPSQRQHIYRVYVSVQVDEISRPRRRLFRTYASSESAQAAAWRWMFKKVAPRRGRPGPSVVIRDAECASEHGGRCVRYTTPLHSLGRKVSAWTVEEVLFE